MDVDYHWLYDRKFIKNFLSHSSKVFNSFSPLFFHSRPNIYFLFTFLFSFDLIILFALWWWKGSIWSAGYKFNGYPREVSDLLKTILKRPFTFHSVFVTNNLQTLVIYSRWIVAKRKSSSLSLSSLSVCSWLSSSPGWADRCVCMRVYVYV